MSSTTNINNSFFEGSYQHAWRALMPPGLSEAEVDLIIEMGLPGGKGKVLDLMCGYGRHALELGRRGIEVMAVDNLASYISEINNKAQEESLTVKAVQSDLLQYKIEGTYDAAICMGNSFNFFSSEEAFLILKNVSDHLRSGGIFLINTWMIAEIAIRYFKEKDWHYAGHYKCLVEYAFKFHPSRIESEQTIISPDGSVEVLKGVDFILGLDDLEAIFQKAGLRTKELYGTPRKRKFNFGDSRIYIVAEKIL